MADKEVTVFVVDLTPGRAPAELGPTLPGVSALPKVSILSALSDALPKVSGLSALSVDKLLWEVLAAKALRGRATDYVSVVTCHAATTNNALAGAGKYQNIDVVADMVVPTYSLMKQLRTQLVPNPAPVADDESDLFLAVIVGLSLLQPTASKKFIRNVVVLTPGSGSMPSFTEETVPVMARTIDLLAVKLVVLVLVPSDHENYKKWAQLCHDVNGSLVDPSLVLAPPVKRVRPLSLFKGSVQLASLGFDVEVYPMVKAADLLPKSHLYLAGSKVIRESSNYIVDRSARDREKVKDEKVKDDTGEKADSREEDSDREKEYDSDDHSFNKKTVSKGDWESGFKYSNYDLIATPKQLLDLATLQSDASIDIMGFVKADLLPYAFYTDDSSYVVPRNLGSERNNLAFEAFCGALLELDSVAVVRYVKQRAKDFQIAALIPMKVAREENSPIHAFSLIRLPYKEDVKIGKFPGLTRITTTSGKPLESEDDQVLKFPNASINKSMENFILARDLDQNQPLDVDKHTYKNFKATMTPSDLSQLPLPISFNLEDTVDDKLNASSPASHKFNQYLMKTIQNSLDHDDLNEFLTDPDFIKKNLVESNDPSNNMFTLSNILKVNTLVTNDWLDNINQQAIPHAKEVIDKLGIRYVDREEYNKTRKKKKLATEAPAKSKGNFGANEEYGEVPEFDL